MGGFTLIKNIDYHFENCSLTIIKGANGSGKTTLLKIIAGIYNNFSGSVNISNTGKILYVGHKKAIKPELNIYENLEWLCSFYECQNFNEKVNTVIHQLSLENCMHIPCGKLSQGQIKKIALAKLKIINAEIWLLDEPFSDLDAESCNWLKHNIEEQAKQGIVIISSHNTNIFQDKPSIQL